MIGCLGRARLLEKDRVSLMTKKYGDGNISLKGGTMSLPHDTSNRGRKRAKVKTCVCIERGSSTCQLSLIFLPHIITKTPSMKSAQIRVLRRQSNREIVAGSMVSA